MGRLLDFSTKHTINSELFISTQEGNIQHNENCIVLWLAIWLILAYLQLGQFYFFYAKRENKSNNWSSNFCVTKTSRNTLHHSITSLPLFSISIIAMNMYEIWCSKKQEISSSRKDPEKTKLNWRIESIFLNFKVFSYFQECSVH